MSTPHERAVALAGLYQAAAEVRRIGRDGNAGSSALQTVLRSVFAFDADSPAGVYGGLASLRPGLVALRRGLGTGRDRSSLEVSGYAIRLIELERRVAATPSLMNLIRSDLEALLAQDGAIANFDAEHIGNLAHIYVQRVSTAGPRIMVNGEPEYLKAAGNPERIRALLLGGVRAVVLWRQLGGNRLNLLLGRRAILRAANEILLSLDQPAPSEI